MAEIFENDSEWSKKHIKHDNRYGYIDCPYCNCHHYMDNYIDDDFEEDDCFKMECNNCEKEKIMDKLTPLEKQRLRKMIGRVVTHFKGKDYLVLDVAMHTETGEDLIIYKALYGDNDIYARPIKMFLSEVDHEKYPDVTQKYRLELKEE